LIVLAILVPTFSAFLGFIIGVVGAAIYNLVAKWLGGLQVEVEEEFDPGVISAMRERMRKARAKSAAKAMRGWIALQTASRKIASRLFRFAKAFEVRSSRGFPVSRACSDSVFTQCFGAT
jgi:hypothetical protein